MLLKDPTGNAGGLIIKIIMGNPLMDLIFLYGLVTIIFDVIDITTKVVKWVINKFKGETN